MGYGVAFIQLIATALYFWYRGFFFFDVPQEGRLLLILRSTFFAMSFTLFIRSMSFLNPVTALMCQLGGLAVAENVLRFFLRQQVGWMILLFKISFTICLLILGWIPGFIPVAAPMIEVPVNGTEETES